MSFIGSTSCSVSVSILLLETTVRVADFQKAMRQLILLVYARHVPD